MNRRALFFLFFSLLPVLHACVPATTIPIGTTSFQQSAPEKRHTLVVFLPGRGGSVASYGSEGFVQSLQQQGISVDTLGVEAHPGYYQEGILVQRLREDVILPAKAAGYRDIWLAGISLGGLGAIFYDTAYPGDLAGLFIMAPYLGEGTLLAEIIRSGGLAGWQPDTVDDGDMEQEIWLKLKGYAIDKEKSSGRVFLGFGESDRFAATNRFFAASLLPRQVVTVAGGHDWPTWRNLWPKLLELSPLLQSQTE